MDFKVENILHKLIMMHRKCGIEENIEFEATATDRESGMENFSRFTWKENIAKDWKLYRWNKCYYDNHKFSSVPMVYLSESYCGFCRYPAWHGIKWICLFFFCSVRFIYWHSSGRTFESFAGSFGIWIVQCGIYQSKIDSGLTLCFECRERMMTLLLSCLT